MRRRALLAGLGAGSLWASSAKAQAARRLLLSGGGITVPQGLVGYWPLNETSGTTTVDIIGGNTGTLNNGVGRGTGQIAGALNFTGSTQNVSITRMTPKAVLFWLNPSAVAGNNMFFDSVGSQTIQCNGASKWDVYSGSSHAFTNGPTLSSWHHYAFVFTGTNCIYYFDGVLTETVSCPQIQINTFARPASAVLSLMDDIRFYDPAPSATQIAQVRTAGQNGRP